MDHVDELVRDPWRGGEDEGVWPGPVQLAGGCSRCSLEDARTLLLADIDDRPQVSGPESAAELVVPQLGSRDREHCVAALLDTKHRLIATATVSVGSVDHTFMGPREILRDALLAGAAAVVLAHNHPSGDPTPSREDELVTRRLAQASEVVGVDLLDHLVIGGARWVSLARRGLL